MVTTDKSLGCGNNPFAFGARNFYGPGLTVDTSKPFTVITQFLTTNNSPTGTLSEIKRMYIQDGRLIENAMVTNVSGQAVEMAGTVNQEFCTARNASDYLRLGGMAGMGQSLARGMVLIFSLWNSDGDFMECKSPLLEQSLLRPGLANTGNTRARRRRQRSMQCYRWKPSGYPCQHAAAFSDFLEHQVSIYPLVFRSRSPVSPSWRNIRLGSRTLTLTRYGDIGSTFNMTGLTVVQADKQAGQSSSGVSTGSGTATVAKASAATGTVSLVLLGLGLLASFAL